MMLDYKKLRKDLIDYYGTAMSDSSPMAMMELSDVERMTEEKLIRRSRELGFDIEKYGD